MSNGKILSISDAAKPPEDEVDAFIGVVQKTIQGIMKEVQIHNAKLSDLNQRLKKIEEMLKDRGPTGVPSRDIN